jgi:hypothetical protein
MLDVPLTHVTLKKTALPRRSVRLKHVSLVSSRHSVQALSAAEEVWSEPGK